LFTEDAVWDGGSLRGVYKGRQAIYDFFKNIPIVFAVHYFVSPIISITGNKAHARWYFGSANTGTNNVPNLVSGIEEDDYIKIDGQWLQTYLKLKLHFYSPLLEGWVKNRMSR
jgi:hypothetical protein